MSIGRPVKVDWRVARAMWEAGDSGDAIAVAVGAAANTIYRAACERGWSKRLGKYDWTLARSMWESGTPTEEIANTLGCTRQAVHDRCKRDGWMPRLRPSRKQYRWRCTCCLGINKSTIDARVCEYCQAPA